MKKGKMKKGKAEAKRKGELLTMAGNLRLNVAINQVRHLDHFFRTDEQEAQAGFPVEPGLKVLTFNGFPASYIADVIRMAGCCGWRATAYEARAEGIIVKWERIDCTREEEE